MKSWALAIAAASGTILFLARAESAVNPPAPEKAKVLVQEMKESDDTLRLLVPAKVEARVASLVTAEAEGFVTVIKKPLGSAVRAGEVVLYVENKDPAFTYAKVPVRAPVSGVVSQIHSSLMSRVGRGDKLFVVTDPKSLKLSAEIPGADLPLVQKPRAEGVFKVRLEDKVGSPIRVVGISPFVDPRTGTAAAELEFVARKGESANFPAIGMVGHALFEMNRGKVLLVPESAIGYSDGKPVVKVIDGTGAVKRKMVELGEQKESLLVVKSGLGAGERIIVRASRTVKDGELVEIEPETQKN